MTAGDFLLCTFEGDTANPPVQFAFRISDINTGQSSLECSLIDSGQQYTFRFGSEPWAGIDSAGVEYSLSTHDIYTPGRIDPATGQIAQVTFADNLVFVAYVDAVDPEIQLSFYHHPYPRLRVDNDVVTESDWDAYPVGSSILSLEGCVLDNELPSGSVVSDDPVGDSTGEEPSGQTGSPASPFLLIDLYPGDLGGKPDWNVLVNTARFYGAIIKATEGTSYSGTDWFKKNWQELKKVGGDRYGKTWFRGAYHFLKFNKNGAAQADYFLDTIGAAGGWDAGDIIPVIDVELGNDGSENPARRNSNQDASAQQIIDCTTACAERIRSRTGSNVMLYGRGAMRDKGIQSSRMGCDIVWNPSYTASMVLNGLQAWDLSDIALWQYCGDGVAGIDVAKLPRQIPGFGAVDISVYVDGKNKPTFESMLQRLGIGTAQN